MANRQLLFFSFCIIWLAGCSSIAKHEEEISKLRPVNSQSEVVKEIYRIKKEVEQTHQVTVYINKFCRTYWGRYKLTDNNNELLTYMRMMQQQMKKYPSGYFEKSRANKICLGKNLSVNGIVVAAMPAPEVNVVIYSISREISGKSKAYKISYQENTFHHELFHNTDYVIWGRHYYKWDKWNALNEAGFKYAGRGTMAYTNKAAMRKMKLQKGFMNKYSQTGMEEDRAEIMEAIMLYPERKLLIKKCQSDEIIRKKVELMIDIVNERILDGKSWSQLETVKQLCRQAA